MLNADIEIQKIDYEKSVKNLLGRIMPKLKDKPEAGMAVRLLQKLGNEAPDVFCNLIRYMPAQGKAKLICELVSQYQEKLTRMVNDALSFHELGKNIVLGSMFFQASGEGLLIFARNVKVNYSGILDNEAVQKKVEHTVQQYADNSFLKNHPKLVGLLKENANVAAKAAAVLGPEAIEKKALKIIESPENKEKMRVLLENVLEQEGLVLKIGQIHILETDEDPIRDFAASDMETEEIVDGHFKRQQAQKPGFAVSEEMEELVLEALSKYLKASVT